MHLASRYPIDGTVDMLIDIQRLDAAQRNILTDVKRDSILSLIEEFDFTDEEIAEDLALEVALVREARAQIYSSGYRLK